MQEVTRTLHTTLSSGKEGRLGEISERMVESLGRVVERFVREVKDNGGRMGVGLMEWVRHAITIAATDAIYGERNPFRDRKVEEGFW